MRKKKKGQQKRPPKMEEAHLLSFLDSRPPVYETVHGKSRTIERGLYMADVRSILWGELTRRREKSRDRWEPLLKQWSYSFTGTDRDGRKLRMIIAIDNGVLLVTAYTLRRQEESK